MNPTPWKAVRHNPVNVTIEDANGVALATAHQFPPYCDSMETATRIVEAVNGIEDISLEAARLRMELDEQKAVAIETGKQKLDALFEAAKLRDLVRRLAEYIDKSIENCDGWREIHIVSSDPKDNYDAVAADLLAEAREAIGEAKA